jgi:hypothetical protein
VHSRWGDFGKGALYDAKLCWTNDGKRASAAVCKPLHLPHYSTRRLPRHLRSTYAAANGRYGNIRLLLFHEVAVRLRRSSLSSYPFSFILAAKRLLSVSIILHQHVISHSTMVGNCRREAQITRRCYFEIPGWPECFD